MRTCEETPIRLHVICFWERGLRSHSDSWSCVPRKPIDIFIGIGIDITGLSLLVFTIENYFICWVESLVVFATDINRDMLSFVC